MSEEPGPAVVFDCMTYLQATISPGGPAAACLRLLEAGRFRLFVSEAVLREVRDVLDRPRIRRKNPRLTDAAVSALIERLGRMAMLVVEVPREFFYERDPKDEPYVNLALAAGARYLVTRDKDLLDLMDETREEGKAFRERYPALTILDPATFLGELRKRESAAPPESSGEAAAPTG